MFTKENLPRNVFFGVVIIGIAVIGSLIYSLRDKPEDFYGSLSRAEVENLLDPPLDTITKTKAQGLYDKYHVTPSLTFRLVKFNPKLADEMIFDVYRNEEELFVIGGYFELFSGDTAQSFRLEGKDTVLFKHKLEHPDEWILNIIRKKDEVIAKSYIRSGKLLAFVKEREGVWCFEPDVSKDPLLSEQY